jgi:cation:H+ antiporter
MLSHALFFLLGLVALIAGAEALVRDASKFALSLGVSSLVVGLTIVTLVAMVVRDSATKP